MPDYEVVSRSYFELAEGAWGGSLRAFAAFLARQLECVESLAGSDERVCSQCGCKNFSDDGLTHQHGIWISYSPGVAYCQEHWPAEAMDVRVA